MDIIREIKWAYQRVARGYDDRIFWGFDGYFRQFIPAVKKFCEDWIADEEIAKYNTDKTEIMKETLRLIKEFNEMTCDDDWKPTNQEDALWEYFGKHIRYYWD
jgi:hypothetical protein